jgi:hypothetical protein
MADETDMNTTAEMSAYQKWEHEKLDDIHHDVNAIIRMSGDDKMSESYDSGLLAGMLSNRGVDPGIVAMLDNRARSGDWGDGGFLTLLFLIILMGGGNGFGGWGGRYGLGQEMGHDDINHTIINQDNYNQLMTAISQQGQNSQNAIQALAGALNTDYNMVSAALAGVDKQLAINNGDMKSAIQQCCCNMRLELERTSNQTNLAMERGFSGQNTLMQGLANGLQNQASQIAYAQQSNATQNTQSIINAITSQSAMIQDQFCQIRNREDAKTIQDLRDKLAEQRDNSNLALVLAAIQNKDTIGFSGVVDGTNVTGTGTLS